MLSCFSHGWLCNCMDCSLTGSSAHGISRQEYWSGSPCPSPGDLPGPGTEPISRTSPALAGGFFTTNAIWEAHIKKYTCLKYTVQLLWYIQSCPTTLLPNARTLPSWKETLYPVAVTTYPHPNHYYVDLPTVDISYKWNHTKSGLSMSDFYCLA